MNTDVVILICRVHDRNWGWGNCDWRDNDDHDHDDIRVDSSSDPRIRRGSSCANAIRRLLNAGFRLIDTETVEDCGIKIVYTFVRRRDRDRDRDRDEAISPVTSDRC
jgi:hypothetical protein